MIICGKKLGTRVSSLKNNERAAFVSHIEIEGTNLKATQGALRGESNTPANGGAIFGLVGGGKPPAKTGFQRSRAQAVGHAGSGLSA